MDALKLKQYEIMADVAFGICLPDDQSYRVKLQIGADYCETTPKPISSSFKFNQWCHRFERRVIKTPIQSLSEMDLLYVYLIDEKDVPVCFWKGKLT